MHMYISNSFGSYEGQLQELLLLPLGQLLPGAIAKAPQIACWFCPEEKVLIKYMNTKKGKGKCNFKITERSLQPQSCNRASLLFTRNIFTHSVKILMLVLFLFPEASTQFASWLDGPFSSVLRMHSAVCSLSYREAFFPLT